ncbi:hypothetical protein MIND_00196700 [Mycena indigotica]|uniref:DUF2421 domain-containing protein n=1 Tax=Mycena indigotica TaxID=2126181 RepID=A0A8H6T9K8_9AGAR|nr:uncharacterized protein MIND_00196700 [Mycena indigotica]KAF7311860.1 hypothetical protein MIND_00196700 [Mycena indigotica]
MADHYDLGGLDYETFVWDHRMYRNLFLAGLVLLVYDHLLVFPEEVKLVWGRNLKPSTWWYLLVRYTALVSSGVILVFYFGRLNERVRGPREMLPVLSWVRQSCEIMENVLEALLVLQECLVQATLFLRVFAMYGRSLWLLGPIWVVANLNLGLGIWTIATYGRPRMLDAPGMVGCHTAIPHKTGLRLGGTWIAQMVSDTMVFGLTVYRAYQEQAVMTALPSSLIERMARDGALYFGIIVLANLANVLTCFLGDIIIAGLLSWWTTSLSIVLICRLILNMQEMAPVGARTEGLDSTELEGIHFAAEAGRRAHRQRHNSTPDLRTGDSSLEAPLEVGGGISQRHHSRGGLSKHGQDSMGQAGFFSMILDARGGDAAWDKALLAQRVGLLRQAGAAANLTAAQSQLQLQEQIFHGYFLDPRSSAVYGAFFFIGTFFFGVVRARVPRLMLTGIFGTIVLDAVCTIGPLLPSQNYLIAKMFLIPTAYYLAIAITSLVLIFPESLNHVWLTTVDTAFFGECFHSKHKIFTYGSHSLPLHFSLSNQPPSILVRQIQLNGLLVQQRVPQLGRIGLIDLEISMGRLGPGDLKRIAPEIRALGFRVAALVAFQTAVSAIHEDDRKDADRAAAIEKERNIPSTSSTPKLSTHETRFARRRRVLAQRELAHGHALDDLVPILAEASLPLRTTCEKSMKALRVWFDECNSGRWTSLVRKRSKTDIEKSHSALVNVTAELKDRLEQWRKEGRIGLIKPYERFFDPGTGKLKQELVSGSGNGMFAVRSLFICFVFCDTVDAFGARLLSLLALATDLDSRRPHPRLWLPSGFGKLWRKMTSRAPAPLDSSPLAMGIHRDPAVYDDAEIHEAESSTEDISETAFEEREEEERELTPARPKNPDAREPTSTLGRLSVRIGSGLRFFKSDEGIFALRHAFLSLAFWVPSVVPHSAWFYYSNKGLWALIMGQMGLATYAGDQLFGVATRLVGTGLGLLLGMVMWYIAAPGLHTSGNPYAVVVVTTVFVAPFLVARISAPPTQMLLWSMIGITGVFVVGYSWLDTHLVVIGNQGVGISLGWRRALLVMIGFTGAGIIMLFPRPTSSRTLVRRTVAASLHEIGFLFGQQVEDFLAEETRARAGHLEKEEIDHLDMTPRDKVSPKERRIRRVSQRILILIERLQGLAPSLVTARWEPQVQGLWPHDQYAALHQKELRLATCLALLTGAFSKLDPTWCSILVERTPFLNPNLLSDIFSTIDILSHSLIAGRPIPASLPLLRDRLLYHETLIRALNNAALGEPALSMPQQSAAPSLDDASDGEEDVDSHATELKGGKVDGASIGFKELSLSVLMDEQLPTHSTAVIALGSILTVLDDIAAIVRELCGETTFRGLDALQREYLGREEAAIGTYRTQR